MNEIKTLLILELRSFYGINKFLHTKDQKAKKRYMSISIVWIFLIGMIFTYIGGLVYGLCSLGLSEIVPAYLIVVSSALIIAFGIFTAGNRIFGQKGYDILASMPLKSKSIVISRFLGHYIADLVFTFVIMLPGVAVYGVLNKPSIFFYIFALIAALFVPAIPLAISTLIGTLITALACRMKNKSMMQSVLMVLLVLGIMLGSFSMDGTTQNFSSEQLLSLAQKIGNIFKQIYPPAIWINKAALELSFPYLLLFAALSLAVMALTVYIVSKNFHSIVRRLSSFTAKHSYKIGKIETRSMLESLYLREAKHYFSSSIYVTNTIVGPILGTIMAIALCIVGIDTIKSSLPFAVDIAGIIPFAFSAVFCMMTTTSISVSMEGKQFWVIKSLPISAKALLDSKILFYLSLTLPFFIVSQIAFAIAIKPSIMQFLWMLIIPFSILLLVAVLGITINLKFHSFDWEKEETVVKQSLSSALGGFAGFFISIILGAAVFLIPLSYGNLSRLIICLILWGITALFYKKNNKINIVDL